MTANLDGVRAKLARADTLIEELRGQVDPVVAAVNDSIECEEEDGGTKLVYRLTAVPKVPAEVPAIVGDVLHDARSALDHLAWQLVIFDSKTPSDKTTFPIHDSPTNDNNNNPRVINTNPPIANQALLDAMVQAQPFYEAKYGHDPADDALSILRELNNIDKHRLLLAVVCSLDASMPASWGSNEGDPKPVLRLTPGPLDVGSVVATFDFQGKRPRSYFEPNLALTVSLMDDEARWLRHKNIVEGMKSLVHGVRWQINHGGLQSFVRLLTEQPV